MLLPKYKWAYGCLTFATLITGVAARAEAANRGESKEGTLTLISDVALIAFIAEVSIPAGYYLTKKCVPESIKKFCVDYWEKCCTREVDDEIYREFDAFQQRQIQQPPGGTDPRIYTL